MRRDRQILNLTEAAQRSGVSRRTLYQWIADGKLEARKLGPCIIVRLDRVLEVKATSKCR